jgi:hypothetical protein
LSRLLAGCGETAVEGDVDGVQRGPQRLVQRVWPYPVGLSAMTAMQIPFNASCSLGKRPRDDSFLAVLHADHRPVDFALPGPPWPEEYEVLVDTSHEDRADPPHALHDASRAR